MADVSRFARTTVPVLSLKTVDEGLPIKIDGKTYLLSHPDSLPIGVLRRFEEQAPRVSDLMELKRPTKAQKKELSALLLEFVSAVVAAPPAVIARLRDWHCVQVMNVFTTLRAPQPRPSRGATTPAHPATRRRSARRSRG